MTANKVLFVTEDGSINYDIPGGVQVCTEEMIDYFKLTSFDLEIFSVKTTRRISDRLKIKLGIDVFNSFDFERLSDDLARKIDKTDIELIALNQIGFAPLVPLLKKKVRRKLFFICLSHGNESGDFLYSSERIELVKLWKLGKLLSNEKKYYKDYLDGVVVISEHEVGINQWLGATNIFLLPRMLKDNAIAWQPNYRRVGFVGTLNHQPNLIGLNLVLESLNALSYNGRVRLIGGPKEIGESLAVKYSFVDYVGRLNEEELTAEASTWSLYLNPVFWYSRGSSTKLAQGINWKIPVLTTPAGKRGYLLSDETVVIANHDPRQFAKTIIEVCNDPQLLNRFQSSVKRNLEDFDKLLIAKKFDFFLKSILKCRV
jgi:glycosyltransferase involved in cell wall biosynthesis